MSGVMRNIMEDITESGKTGEAAMAAMSPEAICAEKGTAAEERREDSK